MRYVCWLGWLLPLAAAVAAPEPTTSNGCLICHSSQTFAIRDVDGTVRSLFVNPAEYFASAHGRAGCLSCHLNLGPGPHGPVDPGDVDPRWRAVLNGRPDREKVAAGACMSCHEAEAREYLGSIHGTKAAEGNTATPLCHDCHGNHTIDRAGESEHAIANAAIPATCASCHGDALLMARFDVTSAVVTTYESSFHGNRRALGSEQVAVCTSCHGVHDIRAPEDPQSTVNPANAAETCGQGDCHPGADAKFAASFKHAVPSHEVNPLVYHVKHTHHYIMVTVLSVMFIHIVLDIWRRKLNEWRRRR